MKRSALVLSLALLCWAARPALAEDAGWSGGFSGLIQKAKTLGSGSQASSGRKMDAGMAEALFPVLQSVLSRAAARHVDFFGRRQGVFLDTQFFGALDGLRPEVAQWLYRSDVGDWAQPDASGDSVARYLARRFNNALKPPQILTLLMVLKNQLVRPAALRASQLFGGVDPFSDPSLVFPYDQEGETAVPGDVRALGEALMREGRASWGDPKKVCDSINIPPSEKGERPTVQNMYYQNECTCMARALREAMARRGLPAFTVGLMKLAAVQDSSLQPEQRKWTTPGLTMEHTNIPPSLRPYAAKPEKVGLFGVESMAPGLPLSAKADPDPTVKPTPPDSWNFHVAAAFRANGETYVLDPITSKSALTVKGWMEMFANPQGRVLVQSLKPVR